MRLGVTFEIEERLAYEGGLEEAERALSKRPRNMDSFKSTAFATREGSANST